MKNVYSIPIKKNALLAMLLLCCSLVGFSQRKITGKISDNDSKSGLPGASVQVKGTNKGTTSNSDGAYSLDVANGATLIFSSLGFLPQEVTVSSQSVINISLTADIKSLSEVVVTGYASQRKKDITGAVTVVDRKSVV